MQFDKFTLKSQEAIQAAQQLAAENGNQEITSAHLAQTILEQPDGVVAPALERSQSASWLSSGDRTLAISSTPSIPGVMK